MSPSSGQLYDGSGAIATGGTAQTAVAARPGRTYLLFQNISDTVMWINFGVAAVADKPSIQIAASGGSIVFEGSFVPSGLVSVMCATTGKKFNLKEA